MKQTIRLTESALRSIIKEAINEYITHKRRKMFKENEERTIRVEYDEELSRYRGRKYYYCPDNGRYYTNQEGRWLTCTDNYFLEPDCHVADDVNVVVVS